MRIKKSRWSCVWCKLGFSPLKPQQLYGLVRWAGKGYFAHRVAYEHFNGPIAEGFLVCHTCDNPPCCNPKHLFQGTQQDNHDDASRKGRTTQGEKSARAKLTSDHVKTIRSMSFEILRYKDVSDLLGCNLTAIAKIYTRESWAHL